jgi:hypothetical protein
LVERQFCKLDVAGSIPVPGSREKEVGFSGSTEYETLENYMTELFRNLTKIGTNYETHIRPNRSERQTLRSHLKDGLATVRAYHASGHVQPLEWWAQQGLDIFENDSDGGYVRVDLTERGRRRFLQN